MNIKVGTAVYL